MCQPFWERWQVPKVRFGNVRWSTGWQPACHFRSKWVKPFWNWVVAGRCAWHWPVPSPGRRPGGLGITHLGGAQMSSWLTQLWLLGSPWCPLSPPKSIKKPWPRPWLFPLGETPAILVHFRGVHCVCTGTLSLNIYVLTSEINDVFPIPGSVEHPENPEL